MHLGAEPEGLKSNEKSRAEEIWEGLERIITVCEREQIDLLLIAGDLFHRQPLLRELKEVNYLFSKLTVTRVVLIAGNHDYIRADSYYHTFSWNENVYPLFGGQMEYAEFDDLQTCVYGFSYYQREIKERLYDCAQAQRRQRVEILLAHGGDEKHIPIKKEALEKLGYDYIAMGHIHKPQMLIPDKAVYAGALEPIDKNDVGKHGYVLGEITEKGRKISFVPNAKREYVHVPIEVDRAMTNGALKEKIRAVLETHGRQHFYKFILKGFRDADIPFALESVKQEGNVLEIVDETSPAYDFEKLWEKNEGNLLGRYIASFRDCEKDSVEYQALYEGVQALMETKRG